MRRLFQHKREFEKACRLGGEKRSGRKKRRHLEIHSPLGAGGRLGICATFLNWMLCAVFRGIAVSRFQYQLRQLPSLESSPA